MTCWMFSPNLFLQNSSFLHTWVDFCFGIYSQQSKDNTAKNYTFLKDRQKKLMSVKGTSISSSFGNTSEKMLAADPHLWCLLLSISSKRWAKKEYGRSTYRLDKADTQQTVVTKQGLSSQTSGVWPQNVYVIFKKQLYVTGNHFL